MESQNGNHHHIPKDVITDILWRLPVKSLMRFRCVCKYWYTLLTNPSFITKHLHKNNNSNNGRLLVKHYSRTTDSFTFTLFPESDETLASLPPLYHDFQTPIFPSNVVESLPVVGFNGMLCLCIDFNHILLWNPATRESRPLLIPQPSLPPYFNAFDLTVGVGLDPVTNHYKVVLIRCYWDEKYDQHYDPRVVAVYTLGTDCWRLFEVDFLTLNRYVYNSLCNTYVNGVYYWLTKSNDRPYVILSFDMGNENFRDIPGPPDLPKSHWGDLALYDDSIAMILYDPLELEKHFDIWVMKEEACWTKQLTIGPVLHVQVPLGFWKNGDLFLETSNSQLLLYNLDTQTIKDLGPWGNVYGLLQVLIYNESLVSVKGAKE